VTSSTSRGGRSAVYAVLIVAVGTLGSVLLYAARRPSPKPAHELPVEEPVTGAPRDDGREGEGDSRRTAALERRIAQLESALAARQAPEATASRTPNIPATPEEAPSAQEVEEMHNALIARHGASPVNRQWAEMASTAFTADLARPIEGTHFKVNGVECRSTTCTVNLEWPSREQAVNEWQAVLVRPTRANCGKQIVIPERPPHESGPMRATMFIDCSTWVEAGSALPPEDQLPVLVHR
jgi:hypothetical protein